MAKKSKKRAEEKIQESKEDTSLNGEQEDGRENSYPLGDKSGKVVSIAESFWTSDPNQMKIDSVSPKESPRCLIHKFDPTFAFVFTFANVCLIDTDDGVVMIDSGHSTFARVIKKEVRKFSSKPVHTCIYTHHHVDHVMGILSFEEVDKVNVIGHENVPKAFDRYKMTCGYNAIINNKQFGSDSKWPETYRYPDTLYRDSLKLTVGRERIELYHGMGETDDATWVWLPERKYVCTGDFFIWATPNCGNPQKHQRYPLEWAQALRKMDSLRPILLLPGHGPPIMGEDRIHDALSTTASFLEEICKQTLDMINEGMKLSEILSKISIPGHYFDKSYLQPVYDDPEFIVHNLWRRYAGWWDQDPSHLRVKNFKQVAEEVCNLAGGASHLAKRAEMLLREGKIDAAVSMVEWSATVDPDNKSVHRVRSQVYDEKCRLETSLMAQGIYRAAKFKSEEKLSSLQHVAHEIEKLAIRIAEKTDTVYEASLLRRYFLDFFTWLMILFASTFIFFFGFLFSSKTESSKKKGL